MSNSSLPNSVEKSHTLVLGSQGKFAVHIIDDLVVVHQQESKTSLIFDIERVDVIEHDLNPEYIRPVYDSSSIYYSSLADKNADVELCCMWFVELNLESSLRNFIYKVKLEENVFDLSTHYLKKKNF
uniref:Uncharacterized protein n=1 Tax=Romanomermis culicivorax TaxID=13658 RepID=A0A915I0G2_ROMCU